MRDCDQIPHLRLDAIGSPLRRARASQQPRRQHPSTSAIAKTEQGLLQVYHTLILQSALVQIMMCVCYENAIIYVDIS